MQVIIMSKFSRNLKYIVEKKIKDKVLALTANVNLLAFT